jgi:hypothetical protein
MQPFNAVVKNGRLTLDEPMPDLEEGQVVVLLPLEDLLAAADAFANDDSQNGSGLFHIVSGPPREWKKPKPVDARALIDELKRA